VIIGKIQGFRILKDFSCSPFLPHLFWAKYQLMNSLKILFHLEEQDFSNLKILFSEEKF